jgi:hypothetical protein
MSAGTRNRIVRIDDETWSLFTRVTEHRNAHRDAEPWTLSDFIRIACREKVAKMDRSRGRELTIADEPANLEAVADLDGRDDGNLFRTIESGEATA